MSPTQHVVMHSHVDAADAELDRRVAERKAFKRKAEADVKAWEREKERQAAEKRKVFKP